MAAYPLGKHNKKACSMGVSPQNTVNTTPCTTTAVRPAVTLNTLAEGVKAHFSQSKPYTGIV